jgi:hypothetical protein
VPLCALQISRELAMHRTLTCSSHTDGDGHGTACMSAWDDRGYREGGHRRKRCAVIKGVVAVSFTGSVIAQMSARTVW